MNQRTPESTKNDQSKPRPHLGILMMGAILGFLGGFVFFTLRDTKLMHLGYFLDGCILIVSVSIEIGSPKNYLLSSLLMLTGTLANTSYLGLVTYNESPLHNYSMLYLILCIYSVLILFMVMDTSEMDDVYTELFSKERTILFFILMAFGIALCIPSFINNVSINMYILYKSAIPAYLFLQLYGVFSYVNGFLFREHINYSSTPSFLGNIIIMPLCILSIVCIQLLYISASISYWLYLSMFVLGYIFCILSYAIEFMQYMVHNHSMFIKSFIFFNGSEESIKRKGVFIAGFCLLAGWIFLFIQIQSATKDSGGGVSVPNTLYQILGTVKIVNKKPVIVLEAV
ncbi:hypothetical protein NEOKW01_0762 [Nematocida sp. AWRm80]|nr:hypothetical protein NEOKW01_0762 [Nematocida sp. AWRm80]